MQFVDNLKINKKKKGRKSILIFSLDFFLAVIFVIVGTQVSDLLFTHHITKSIFQFYLLDKEIMLRIEIRQMQRALKIEGKPFLDSREFGSLG